MSATDPTLAARAARHRARKAAHQDDVLVAIDAMRQDLAGLTATVSALVETLRNGYPPLRNGQVDRSVAPVDNRRRTASNRREPLRNGEGAGTRTRRGDVPPPPTGDGGNVVSDVREDAWKVATVLTSPASAGAIRDALNVGDGQGLSLGRVVAALGYLAERGEVVRQPGDGPRPDRWAPVREDVVGPVRLASPPPSVHVACTDYRSHQGEHRWDPVQGAFRCYACSPDPGTRVPPTSPRAAVPSHVGGP